MVAELMVNQSKEDSTVRRWPFPYHYGPAHTALIDNPRITPLLHGRLGGDVKLDHEYVQTLKPDGSGRPSIRCDLWPHYQLSAIFLAVLCLMCRSDLGSGGIHGGPNHLLQSDAITGSGKGELLTVVYELLDVTPEDGGFGAVTGSHKTRYTLPIPRQVDQDTLTYPDGAALFHFGVAVTGFDAFKPLFLTDLWSNVFTVVTRVSAKAGAAIVFSEYMMHTTYPWTGAGQRKSIFYKFPPREYIHTSQNLTVGSMCDMHIDGSRYSARDVTVPTLATHGCITVDEQVHVPVALSSSLSCSSLFLALCFGLMFRWEMAEPARAQPAAAARPGDQGGTGHGSQAEALIK